jgi:hypothetical protein
MNALQSKGSHNDDPYWFRNLSAPFREVMKFHLVYSGRLSSGSTPKPNEARDIRDQLSPQLKRLWETHRALQVLGSSSWVRGAGARPVFLLPSPSPFDEMQLVEEEELHKQGLVNLCAPLQIAEKHYIPLVRKTLDLNCSLEILFLRKGDPGALVTQDGDIDNRMKVLLDALKMPSPDNAQKYPQSESPTYCLMESDSLVQGLDIDTDRLLFPQTQDEKEVHLVIEVTVHVLRVGHWNVCLV